MTTHDLARYIDDVLETVAWAQTGEEAAQHIATELGWRPPARSLRTVGDLKALPHRSIVLGRDDVTYRRSPWGLRESTWYPLDGWDAFHRDFGVDVEEIALPATLLHEGGH